MAHIYLAELAGFCGKMPGGRNLGVTAAYETLFNLRATHPDFNIAIYDGPIAHNPTLTVYLKNEGIVPYSDISSISNGSIVVARAHGITKGDEQRIRENVENGNFFEFVDCTCPLVKKVHRIVDKGRKDGKGTIILGKSKEGIWHPEVKGIMSYANPDEIYIIQTLDELKALAEEGRFDSNQYDLVFQTTMGRQKLQDPVLAYLEQNKHLSIKSHDTICDATKYKQDDTQSLAKRVDAMVVVGGKGDSNTKPPIPQSSNTRELNDICVGILGEQDVFWVETAQELDHEALSKYETIGVTAGASCPDFVIDEVMEELKKVN